MTNKKNAAKKPGQKKESKYQVTQIITHVYLHDKFLRKIADNLPKSVQVLYLHCNEISQIENLLPLKNLTNLYLQKNQIKIIEGLDTLINLRKLYLGNNMISVVENLDKLKYLEELHIEKQQLLDGNSLCFDPRTVLALSNTLKILNVSYNKLETLINLVPLNCLSTLDVSYNNLNDLDEIGNILKHWIHLKEINFINNPIVKNHQYQFMIIANSQNLETLDKKFVSEPSKRFLKNLYIEKKNNNLRKPVNLGNHYDILKHYPVSIQKAASDSIMKEQRLAEIEQDLLLYNEKEASYIPWKKLTNNTGSSKRPLLLRKKISNVKPKTNFRGFFDNLSFFNKV